MTVALTEEVAALSEQLAAVDGDDEQMSAADQAVQQKLEEVHDTFIAVDTRLDDVVQAISEATNLNIHVRWYALDAIGVSKDTPISLEIEDVTWEEVLDTILGEVGGEQGVFLLHDVEDGVVSISTGDDWVTVFSIPLEIEPSAEINAALYAALAGKITVALDGIALADVFEYLQDTQSLNMDVRWTALQEVGIDQETTVDLELTDVSVDKILRTILEDVGEGTPLCYMVDEGVLTISTTEDIYSSDE